MIRAQKLHGSKSIGRLGMRIWRRAQSRFLRHDHFMKRQLSVFIGGFLLCSAFLPVIACASEGVKPVKVIFDTDMGNDVDDALALSLIHSLQRRGACELLAVTLTNPEPLAGAYVDAVNTFYGNGDIPIGRSPKSPSVEPNKFVQLAEVRHVGGERVFPHDFDESKSPLAVDLLRKVLAASADGEVVIVQVGFSTNLAALLASGADKFSELDGMDLVKKKVRSLSVMAGAFQTTADDN